MAHHTIRLFAGVIVTAALAGAAAGQAPAPREADLLDPQWWLRQAAVEAAQVPDASKHLAGAAQWVSTWPEPEGRWWGYATSARGVMDHQRRAAAVVATQPAP